MSFTKTQNKFSKGIDDKADSTAITIDANENVGIGTGDPTALLHCAKTASGLTARFSNEANQTLDVGTVAGSGATGSVYLDNPNSGNMQFRIGGSERMRIDASGRVGIGSPSNTPLASGLTVRASDGTVTFNPNVGSENYAAVVYHNGNAANRNGLLVTNNWMSTASKVLSVGSTNASSGAYTPYYEVDGIGNHLFSSVSGGPPVTIQAASGKVGIGTNLPSGNLDVENAAGVQYTNLTSPLSGAASVLSLLGGAVTEQAICYNEYALRFGTVTGKNGVGFTERMRINSVGSVGIGTGPLVGAPLHVNGSSSNGVAGYLRLQNGTTDTGYTGTFFSVDPTYAKQAIYAQRQTVNGVGPLIFAVDSSSDATDVAITDEKMRLDASGNLLVGTTSLPLQINGGVGIKGDTGTYGLGITNTAALADGVQASMFLTYRNSLANVGCYKHSLITNPAGYLFFSDGFVSNSFLYHNGGTWRSSNTSADIGTTGGTVIGTQTSDERLKDIEPTFEYGIDAVMSLQPIAYTRNDVSSPVRQLGFGAQTTQAIVPEAVYDTGECLDGYDTDPEDAMVQTAKSEDTKLAMEYVQLVPVLTKAIQEQQAMIETLQAEVAALKGA